MISILMEHEEDVPMVALRNGIKCANFQVGHLVVGYASDVDEAVGKMARSHVIACNAPIGATINQGTTIVP